MVIIPPISIAIWCCVALVSLPLWPKWMVDNAFVKLKSDILQKQCKSNSVDDQAVKL